MTAADRLAFPPATPGGSSRRGLRPQPVELIGLADDRFELLAPEARQALAEADVVVGPRRQLWLWQSWAGRAAHAPSGEGPEVLEIEGDPVELARTVHHRAVDGQLRVCVLAPGDPGFFGVLPALLSVLDRRAVRVRPAPSPVSVAFARLALSWDDARVVATRGRSVAEVAGSARVVRKAAVLTSPDVPPEVLGRALLEAGAAMDLVAVCSRLGAEDETVTELTLEQLAGGSFDPASVVVLVGPGGLPLVGWGPTQWSADEDRPVEPASELDALVLAKLALPARGVVWSVAERASQIAVQCATLRPGLTVLAAGEAPSAGAAAAGLGVHAVSADLEYLPAPDRAFVGQGDLAALGSALNRLRPGGRVVATFSALEQAVAAAELLGNLLQLQLAGGARQPGGWHLAAQDPVFVTWGPAG